MILVWNNIYELIMRTSFRLASDIDFDMPIFTSEVQMINLEECRKIAHDMQTLTALIATWAAKTRVITLNKMSIKHHNLDYPLKR